MDVCLKIYTFKMRRKKHFSGSDWTMDLRLLTREPSVLIFILLKCADKKAITIGYAWICFYND